MDNVVVIREDVDVPPPPPPPAAEAVRPGQRRVWGSTYEGGRDRPRYVRHAVSTEMLDEGREINESIKRYIVYPIHRDKTTALLGRAILEGENSLLRRAKRLLEAYKTLEQVCLLQLAVSDIPPDMSLKTLVAWKLWESEGWKVNKERHVHCKETPIIITAVLPFLSDKVRIQYLETV